ncbi:hypothetical protein RFI_18856, partial [Reticulomyxa filosa]
TQAPVINSSLKTADVTTFNTEFGTFNRKSFSVSLTAESKSIDSSVISHYEPHPPVGATAARRNSNVTRRDSNISANINVTNVNVSVNASNSNDNDKVLIGLALANKVDYKADNIELFAKNKQINK